MKTKPNKSRCVDLIETEEADGQFLQEEEQARRELKEKKEAKEAEEKAKREEEAAKAKSLLPDEHVSVTVTQIMVRADDSAPTRKG